MCRLTNIATNVSLFPTTRQKSLLKKCVIEESVVVTTLSWEYVVATSVSLFQRQILETLSLDMTNVRFSRKCLCNDTFSNDTFFRRGLSDSHVSPIYESCGGHDNLLRNVFLTEKDRGDAKLAWLVAPKRMDHFFRNKNRCPSTGLLLKWATNQPSWSLCLNRAGLGWVVLMATLLVRRLPPYPPSSNVGDVRLWSMMISNDVHQATLVEVGMGANRSAILDWIRILD